MAQGRNIVVEIQIIAEALSDVDSLLKNRFMILATPTDLQSSENFKLQKFWEDKEATKDKANLQQIILKINLSSGGAGKPVIQNRETIVANTSSDIRYEGTPGMGAQAPAAAHQDKKSSVYEKAPGDDINISQVAGNQEQQTVQKLESDIHKLKQEIEKQKKQMSNKEGAETYKWNSSDNDKGGDGAQSFNLLHLVLALVVAMGIGAYLIK